ncbi:MAG: ISAs1 family transposase, partial [Myxococcales bacterium]|nr:ISAs1 family transposase [Myxococcales bacterium]
SAPKWASLSCVIEVKRERIHIATGETSSEIAYYIGSEKTLQAKETARIIRRHWGIENELYWVLDMAFREDEARHRAKNTAQNLTTLRHFALNMVKQD